MANSKPKSKNPMTRRTYDKAAEKIDKKAAEE